MLRTIPMLVIASFILTASPSFAARKEQGDLPKGRPSKTCENLLMPSPCDAGAPYFDEQCPRGQSPYDMPQYLDPDSTGDSSQGSF